MEIEAEALEAGVKDSIYYLCVVGIVVLVCAVSECSRPYDSCDSKEHGRCGAKIIVDDLTGCHYLGSVWGTVTPRMDRSGNQVCIGHEAVK